METQKVLDNLSRKLKGARGESGILNGTAAVTLEKSPSWVTKAVNNQGAIKVVDLIDLAGLYGLNLSRALGDALNEERRAP